MRPIFQLITLSSVVFVTTLGASEGDAHLLNIDRLDHREASAKKPAAPSALNNFDLHTDYAAALAQNSAAPAKADAPAAASSEKPKREQIESAHGRFEKGTWRVNAFGGLLEAIDGGQTIFFGGTAVEYFIINDLSLRAEVVGYSVDQRHWEDSMGGGLNALARWYALKSKDRRLSMFIEGGGGLAEFDGRTPGRHGTDFNFTLHVGFGGDFKLSDRISLIAAPKYMHISNANLQGKSRNPGIDSLGGYLGIVVKF